MKRRWSSSDKTSVIGTRTSGERGVGIRVQTVAITFSDGRSGVFVGPALLQSNDCEDLKITGFVFTEPVELPGDYSWMRMSDVFPKKE